MTVAERAALNVQLRQRTAAGHEQYQDDPVGFVTDVLGAHLWSKQREIAEAVRDHRHVVVPFVVSSAPTFSQVRAILWREIGRAHRKGRLRGRVNQTEWHMPVRGGEEIVAYGRKPSDWHEDAFQGIHARYVLVILDEAGGIPRSLFTAAETITTNEHSRVLAIGNPDHPGTQFQQITQSPDWRVIQIDGLETPNFTDEAVPDELRGLLLSKTWVVERGREWGVDDPQFISKVRRRFPQRPAGAVYQVDPGIHLWAGDLPPFKKFVGGLDFGGQNLHDYAIAGIVAGITAAGFSTGSASIGENRLIRLACFKDSGPKVYERIEAWIKEWQRRTRHGTRARPASRVRASRGCAPARSPSGP